MKTIIANPNTQGTTSKTMFFGLAAAAVGLMSLATVAKAQLAAAPMAAATTTNASTNTPALPYGSKIHEGFWKRFDEEELSQAGTASNPPADTNAPAPPVRRIGPTPFDSPPYPDMDWQIGGGPNVIGDPGALRDSPWPFMAAVYDGPNGKFWYESRLQLYGWWTIAANVSSSRLYTSETKPNGTTVGGPQPNFPEVYPERSDRAELDQFVVYLERMADENQTDHIDWGFRIAFLYGLDYRFMASRGYLNDVNLLKNNHFIGFDTPMTYFNIYIPKIMDGESIIIGRIVSEPDIEQQLAPNNLMASHSLVYAFDDYTVWGIFTSTKINANWILQVNLMDGVDIAPWETQDPGDQPTIGVNVQYIGSGGKDSFYVGCNSLNNGTFGFNNLQECIESYSHKFSEKCWTTFEAQYMWTDHCSTEPTAKVPYQDGYYPTKNGFVAVGGICNYTMYRIAPNAFVTLRNEWWDDPSGYRSGYSSSYYEGSIGMQYWPNKLIMLRPEIRYEHAFERNGLASSSAAFNGTGAPETVSGPYDSGTKQSQVTVACDITYHF